MRKTFTAAMNSYFGRKPGQSLREFGAELKEIPRADKLDFAAMLREIGVDCDDPKLSPVELAAQ